MSALIVTAPPITSSMHIRMMAISYVVSYARQTSIVLKRGSWSLKSSGIRRWSKVVHGVQELTSGMRWGIPSSHGMGVCRPRAFRAWSAR
jgi:hypothetical protein